MKALLIISIPEDFDYRKCKIGGDGNIYYERKGEQRVSIIGNIKNLKLVPKKIDKVDYFKSRGIDYDFTLSKQIDGYNFCVDEITGGK